MSELRCPEECGGCPKCMGPAIELVEATERDEWKARAKKAEAALDEAWRYCETTYWMRKDDTSHGPSMGTVIACEDVLVILRKHGFGGDQ